MELGFITKAMRRYWWVIVAFIAVTTAAAVLLRPSNPSRYESNALLRVSPASGSNGGGPSDDRFVQGEIVTLESRSLAEAVAANVGPDTDATEVANATTFSQIVGTSVIRIVASSPSAERAQKIADGYASAYLAQAAQNAKDSVAPETDALTKRLATLQGQLDDVNTQIAAKLKPFQNSPNPAAPIPAIEALDPALASLRTTLQDQVTDLQKQINALAPSRVTSQLVQPATSPTAPTPAARSLLLLGSPIIGLLLGAVAAVGLARLSPRVLDADEVGEILGASVAGWLPPTPALAKGGVAQMRRVPPAMRPIISELCVRAEANAPAEKICIIVVAATERSAGATTLAIAMANRYAAGGASVALLDANPANPEITRLFATDGPTITSLRTSGRVQAPHPVANAGGNRHQPRRKVGLADEPVASSSNEGPLIVGVGDLDSAASLRREDLPSIIAAASQHASILVFDAGPLLNSASTVQLAEVADAVVLAVPMPRQATRPLQVIARELQDVRGLVLPVAVPATHTVRRPGVPSAKSVPDQVAAAAAESA